MGSKKHLCADRMDIRLLGVWSGTGNSLDSLVSVQGAVCLESSPFFPSRGTSGPCTKGTKSFDDFEDAIEACAIILEASETGIILAESLKGAP